MVECDHIGNSKYVEFNAIFLVIQETHIHPLLF